MCDLADGVCFVQAEDGIRDLVRSRGLGDVYKRQVVDLRADGVVGDQQLKHPGASRIAGVCAFCATSTCLLYTSDAADERSSVDLGGRRIIKKTTTSVSRTVRHQRTSQIARRSRVIE